MSRLGQLGRKCSAYESMIRELHSLNQILVTVGVHEQDLLELLLLFRRGQHVVSRDSLLD